MPLIVKIPDSSGGVGPRAGDVAYRKSPETPAEDASDRIDPSIVIPGAFATIVLEPITYWDAEFRVTAFPATVIDSGDAMNCGSEWSFVSCALPS